MSCCRCTPSEASHMFVWWSLNRDESPTPESVCEACKADIIDKIHWAKSKNLIDYSFTPIE